MLVILPENSGDNMKSTHWREDYHAIEKYRFIHNFLPHKRHKTRARLLSPKALLAYSMAVLSVFIVLKSVPLFFPGILGYASDITISDLFDSTNNVREEVDLPALRLNESLSVAARKKAEDMFEKDYWAHVSPDGTEPWEFILAEGYDYAYAGENLAKNFHYSDEVVEAWFNSPSHKENLVNKNYTEVGFAVVNGVLDGYETTLVVQMFGKVRGPVPLASGYDEEALLESLEVARAPSEVAVPLVEGEKTAGFVDVPVVAKSLNIVLGSILIGLLLLDLWYSRKHRIPKFTGHTLAHLLFLVAAFAGIWLAFVPGSIL